MLYHVNDEDTPYLVKFPISSDSVTLGDLKNALNRPNYKYFFKSMDDDFGYNCHPFQILKISMQLKFL